MYCVECVESAQKVSPTFCQAAVKHLVRQDAALKIPFFRMVRYKTDLVSKVPSLYSPIQSKSLYENERTEAIWGVQVHVGNAMVQANIIYANLVDKERKQIAVI